MNVAFRVKANSETGLGHLMRCLCLADYLKRFAHCEFVISSESQVVIEDIETRGYGVLRIESTNDAILDAKLTCKALPHFELGHSYLIVDCYDFDYKWEAYCSENSPAKLIIIDDLNNRVHSCDYLIDSSLGRNNESYQDSLVREKKLLGIKYLVLKRQYIDRRSSSILRRKKTKKIKNILVSMGATDPKNYTARVLDKISQTHFKGQVTVVTTRHNPHLKHLKNMKYEDVNVFVDHPKIEELATQADLCIGALGTSLMERACIGLPSICVKTAENQNYNALVAEEYKVAWVSEVYKIDQPIDEFISMKPEDRLKITEHLMSIIDGLGYLRVLRECFNIHPVVELRDLEIDDSRLLFQWQNETGARQYSRNINPPSWEEHVNWLQNSLSDSDRRLWIILMDSIPVGYTRLDSKNDTEEVSILVSTHYQGLGIGKLALEAIKSKSRKTIEAYVKEENTPSVKLFSSAGFKKIEKNIFHWRAEDAIH